MQTILGAGGAIGKGLARILPAYSSRVRLVSRNPARVLPANEIFAADLLDPQQVSEAVRGSEVAYLVAGLPYKADLWADAWPRIMRNTLSACQKHACRLVFFDNVYMYDPAHLGAMDEDTPIRPVSRKGRVREQIAGMLMDAAERGQVTALIARCADFYGPGRLQGSVLTKMVLDPLAAGRTARWMCDLDCPHAFTFTPDAAQATALLGNNLDAFGQVWHLPTAGDPPTGRQWIEAAAAELDAEGKTQCLSRLVLKVLGVFLPLMAELEEMSYQYDRKYVFLSDKFNSRFGFQPTSWRQGLSEVVEADYSRAMETAS